ncbi:MAG: hypothetical protein DB853_13750 [Candidatus Brocadia sp.]|nr:MAG: hypothetical protein DB853_13750 [Candidatus Brocadia sp.]
MQIFYRFLYIGSEKVRRDNPKQEAYTILRSAGKSIEEAYKQAGYAGKPGTKAAYALERRVKSYDLVAPDMLKMGHNVARLTLRMAQEVLKDKEKQKLSKKEEICLKEAHEIYREQQRRESSIINRHLNINVNAETELVDLSAYRDYPGEGGEENIEQVINAEFTQQEG